jgi:hypothetical protein
MSEPRPLFPTMRLSPYLPLPVAASSRPALACAADPKSSVMSSSGTEWMCLRGVTKWVREGDETGREEHEPTKSMQLHMTHNATK